MGLSTVLVANRGEIAVRILRAATDLGLRTVAVYSEDDASSMHVRKADEAHALRGSGPTAYLDAEQLIAVATSAGCSAVHPGYGFLSENAEFAARCAREGLLFVGPEPSLLERFGDKTRARSLAAELDVPVLAGTAGVALESAEEFLLGLGAGGAVMVKALSGGGGRGMRPAHDVDELRTAFERCRSEALRAFGDDAVYVEQYVPRARHIEVQIVGDGRTVTHLGERDCSVQRRQQKLIEMTPGPAVSAALRERLTAAAVRMAEHVGYRGLGTFEFLVDTASEAETFLEVNPRLQVEHTVTEEVTGVDLVQAQLRIADGASLSELGLRQEDVPEPTGFALQARVNLETMDPDGDVHPSAGTLTTFEPPSGPGVRVDTHGYTGYGTGARFDSLLAKVVVHASGPDFTMAARRAHRALGEFVVSGPATNLPLLRSILIHPEFLAGGCDTGFVERHRDELHAGLDHPRPVLGPSEGPTNSSDASRADGRFPDAVAVRSPMGAVVLDVQASADSAVRRGQPLVVLEAMKMEHVITAPADGTVRDVSVRAGDQVDTGAPLVFLAAERGETREVPEADAPDVDAIPASLHQVHQRHAVGLDESRPEAMARRRATGRRTARENLDDLCDEGTFVEYGSLAVAAQRRRRSLSDLIERTPADGLVAGLGHVNGDRFGPERSRCVAMSYDYTVLAGTQGLLNHRKTDRMLVVAERKRVPVVLFAEGGEDGPVTPTPAPCRDWTSPRFTRSVGSAVWSR